MPYNIMFTFPTISKMASCVHGINVAAKTKYEKREGEEEQQGSLPSGTSTSTPIVRFHEAPDGQVPLIMLHGKK
jgi:hypothetical protein